MKKRMLRTVMIALCLQSLSVTMIFANADTYNPPDTQTDDFSRSGKNTIDDVFALDRIAKAPVSSATTQLAYQVSFIDLTTLRLENAEYQFRYQGRHLALFGFSASWMLMRRPTYAIALDIGASYRLTRQDVRFQTIDANGQKTVVLHLLPLHVGIETTYLGFQFIKPFARMGVSHWITRQIGLTDGVTFQKSITAPYLELGVRSPLTAIGWEKSSVNAGLRVQQWRIASSMMPVISFATQL